jgi:hypothetical protein
LTPLINTPTPTPTREPRPTQTPHVIPSPTPTPCHCEEVELELNVRSASPGENITATACLPLVGGIPGDEVDLYLLVFAPRGKVYSILPGGVIRLGLVPYYTGPYDEAFWCGVLYSKPACDSGGSYKVALGLVPAGMPPTARDAIDYDLDAVTIVK